MSSGMTTTVQLGELCNLKKGATAASLSEPGAFPLITTSANWKSASHFDFTDEAVCIPLVSSTGHGNASINRLHYVDRPFALASILAAATNFNKHVSGRYLFWYLSCEKDRLLVPLMKGTSNVALNLDLLSSVPVRLPPFAEQRWIVAQLDAAAERVEAHRRIMAEAISELEVLTTTAHLAESDGEVALGEVLRLHEDRVEVSPGRSYPQIGIKGFGGGLFIKSAVAAENTTYRHFNRLFEGAFVVSQVKGWEGAVAVCDLDKEGWFVSPEYRTFRCNPSRLRPGYLSQLCRTSWFHGHLAKVTRGQGARRERLRPENLLALQIPLPKVEKQPRLETAFERADEVRRRMKAAEADLALLLPSLLHSAFGVAAEPAPASLEVIAAE